MRRFVFCLLLLLAPSAQAQTITPDADAIRRSLSDALSFVSFGMIPALGPDAQVTPDGDGFRIHIPLTGVTAPSDPAVVATARRAGDGAWDVQSLSFPSTATIDSKGPGGGAVTYTIGSQEITAHIVPDMKQPTTYMALFRDIHLDSDTVKQRAAQTIAAYSVKGTLSADGDGRVAMTSSGEATDWSMRMTPETGPGMDFMTRRLGIDLTIQGLDRAKGERLRSRLRTLLAELPKPGQRPAPPAGPITGPTPLPMTPRTAGPPKTAPREALNAMLDDAVGLLTRFDADETLEGLKVSSQGINGGAGTVIIGMHGDTAAQKLNAGIDLAVNDMVVPASVPGPFVPYVPKHVSLRSRIRDLPSDQVVALLRAALAEGANPVALQAQAIALLRTPGATVSLDPFSFDAGPLAVTGTARLLPDDNGGFAGHIHVIASGMDTLLIQAQANPALGQMMPMLYMAKGMSKPDGASVVWDIDVDRGGVRINGTPFGHPPAKR